MIQSVEVRLPDGRKYMMEYRTDREWMVRSVLGGRYSWPREPAEDKVRRVLDIGAGCGEFSVHAMTRWPGCWIDWVEEDEELARICESNAVPGSKRLPLHAWSGEYDVVRISMYVSHPYANIMVIKDYHELV